MNEDFIDVLRSLLEEDARFLVVGAYAMAAHGVPRATGDIDIWIPVDASNAARVFRALARFGAPMGSLGILEADFSSPDRVIQIGVPPRRIDVLTGVSALDFDAAWPSRMLSRFAHLDVPVLGREDLIKNKRAAGRPQDVADLAVLEAKS